MDVVSDQLNTIDMTEDMGHGDLRSFAGLHVDVNVVGGRCSRRGTEWRPWRYGSSAHCDAAAGWDFAGWSGDLTGMTNPATLTMNAERWLGNFTTMSNDTLDVVTVGSGAVAADPDMRSNRGNGRRADATPNHGWEFDSWSGDLTGTTNPATLTMTKDMVVTATFTALPTYTLAVNVVGNGSVTVSPDAAYYLEGASVQLRPCPPPTGSSAVGRATPAARTTRSRL